MFHISDDHNILTVEILNKKFDSQNTTITIDAPTKVFVIGKNSVFGNHLELLEKKHSLTFDGKVFVDLPDDVQLKLYIIEGNNGYVVHNEIDNIVWLSRSFSLIVDQCLTEGFSILGIIRHCKGSEFTIPNNIINNDFSKKIITEEDTNADKHFYYDLSWTQNNDYIQFGMIINIDDFKPIKDGIFFEEYRGTALNIGKFRQTILKPLHEDQKTPAYFPEANSDYCIEFTDLEDDNAATVLVPNVYTQREYDFLVDTLKRNNQKTICVNGTSKNGYGVQANIELLDSYESTTQYQARVTRLIIAPKPNLDSTIPTRK